MRDDEIHIGDVVRVRSWDDMVREFGVDSGGDIDFGLEIGKSVLFVEGMRKLCGREVTITGMRDSAAIITDPGRHYMIFSVNSGKSERWSFVSEMFEPAVDYCEIIKSGFELDDLF
jgi:hypothetical protein